MGQPLGIRVKKRLKALSAAFHSALNAFNGGIKPMWIVEFPLGVFYNFARVKILRWETNGIHNGQDFFRKNLLFIVIYRGFSDNFLSIGLDYFQARFIIKQFISRKRLAAFVSSPYVGSCESVNISYVFLGRWTAVLTHWLPLHALLQVSTVSIAVCIVFRRTEL